MNRRDVVNGQAVVSRVWGLAEGLPWGDPTLCGTQNDAWDVQADFIL